MRRRSIVKEHQFLFIMAIGYMFLVSETLEISLINGRLTVVREERHTMVRAIVVEEAPLMLCAGRYPTRIRTATQCHCGLELHHGPRHRHRRHRLGPSRLFRTALEPSGLLRTPQNPSKPLRTLQDPQDGSGSLRTGQGHSGPLRTT